MLTYQDFQACADRAAFVNTLVDAHRESEAYQTALTADEYDRQRNSTIYSYVRRLFTLTGAPVRDFTASNMRVASNFFHRLNTQRCAYSLGNGVEFTKEGTKARLGARFDTDLQRLGYMALIHGVAFGLWNEDGLKVFPLTEFAPLWDEETGALRAGVRFWRLGRDKPARAVLYEEDGWTPFCADRPDGPLRQAGERTAYRLTVRHTAADGDRVVAGENYAALPIIPLWGSRLKQSTLVGMRQAIDSYDLIQSGFANDLSDCAMVYWIIENCGGMTPDDLARFRDQLKLLHIANADTDGGGRVTPYTQEIPFEARRAYLDHMRAAIYESFGGLDVHAVAAGATNDHIDAAYQPMDEEADDFEYQLIGFVQALLGLLGIEDTPLFKRNRVSNQREQVQMLLSEAPYLDRRAILTKLPNVTVDEVKRLLAAGHGADRGAGHGKEGMPLA